MNEQIKTEELIIETPELETKKNKPGFLYKIQQKIANSQYTYLFFAFLVPAVIMYIVYIALGIHPFGERSVLVLDLNGQYVYFFEALRNFVRGDASLLYSFSRALGGEFLGIYAYYLASPLSYLVALFPTAKMLEALLVIILLKTGLCGVTFGFYLHKNSHNRNKFIIVAFSVMYALCAYAVVYQNNIMWLDALICLPLITYGIEQLIKFGKYKLFVVSLATAIMSNFYMGCYIFLLLYVFSEARAKQSAQSKGAFLALAWKSGCFLGYRRYGKRGYNSFGLLFTRIRKERFFKPQLGILGKLPDS